MEKKMSKILHLEINIAVLSNVANLVTMLLEIRYEPNSPLYRLS